MLASLAELRRGLTIQKFASLMESYPITLQKAFQPSEIQILSEIIQDMFLLFCPQGSNKRSVEEAIWIQHLHSLGGMSFGPF